MRALDDFADKKLEALRRLAAEGFHTAAIRSPSGPDGTSRLRMTFTAGHPDAAIERLAGLVRTRILAR